MNLDASTYLLHKTPAIIRPSAAKKWAAWVEEYQSIWDRHSAACDEFISRLKISEAWREKYDTWEAACEHMLGMSQQAADKHVLKYRKAVSGPETTLVVSKTSKIEEKSLNQVEKAREKSAPTAEQWEEKEHFTVKGPPTDNLGRTIPQRCLVLLNRVEEDLQPYIAAASKLSGLFDRLRKDDRTTDAMYSFLYGQLNDGADHAGWLFRMLRDCKPDRVCPQCDGGGKHKSKTCDTCFGTGMVSDYHWRHRIIGGADPVLAEKAKKIECKS